MLLLLCSVRRSCTVHVEMKPQWFHFTDPQGEIRATEIPCNKRTSASSSHRSRPAQICSQFLHVQGTKTGYSFLTASPVTTEAAGAPSNTDQTTKTTCMNLNMTFAFWVPTPHLAAKKNPTTQECMQTDLIIFTYTSVNTSLNQNIRFLISIMKTWAFNLSIHDFNHTTRRKHL